MKKILLGIASLIPIISLAFYFISVAMFFLRFISYQDEVPRTPGLPEGILTLFIPLFIVAISTLANLVYYIVHAVNNKAIESSERLVWIIVFVFAGIVGFPVYWYMRIWKRENV